MTQLEEVMMMNNPEEILICIDPGHAERTPGKRAGTNPTFYEYEGNRRTARMLHRKLEAQGFKVMYSCNLDSPDDLSLFQRAQNARKAGANVFVSVHTNAINITSVRGTETFIHNNSKASLPIANTVQKAMLKHIGQRDRGVKRANFGVLRNSYKHMLSILTEADFFTNPTARDWMFESSFDDAYSDAILEGVAEYYGIALKDKKKPAHPENDKQNNPPSEDVGAALVRVKAENLWVYDKPQWSARVFTVQQGEAFTVMEEVSVGNGRMYKLKSGLYITASEEFVELDGRIADTKEEVAEEKPKNTPTQRKPIRPYPGTLFRLQSPYMRDGNGQTDIQAIQRAIGAHPDGVFGPATRRNVISYQERHNLNVDGIVGPATWNVMF